MINKNVVKNVVGSKDLSQLQKIVLFAFIFLMVGLYKLIMDLMVFNTGIGELRYPRLYLLILPALYIIHRNIWRQSFKVPIIVPFLIMTSVFVLCERYFSYYSDYALHNFEFVWRQFYIYVFFLIMVNFGLDRITFYKTIDYALYSCILVVLISLGGFTDLYKLGDDSGTQLTLFMQKPTGFMKGFSATNVSYTGAFAIFLLTIKQCNEKLFSPIRLVRDFGIISLSFAQMFINGSRGPLLISLILAFYYLILIKKKSQLNFYIISFFIIISFVGVAPRSLVKYVMPGSYELLLVKRVRQIEETTATRRTNISNTWENFINHPFSGVGYEGAARLSGSVEGTRSNNQYAQLLASSGIIFVIIYLYYIYKFAVFRFYLLKRPEVILSLIFLVSSNCVSRPFHMYAIFGYIAYYFYYNYKISPSSASLPKNSRRRSKALTPLRKMM